jgi:hypothetical protein
MLIWTEPGIADLRCHVMAVPLSVSTGGEIEVDLLSGQFVSVPVDLGLVGGPFVVGLEAFITDSDDLHVVWAAAKGPTDYGLFTQNFDSQLHAKGDPVMPCSASETRTMLRTTFALGTSRSDAMNRSIASA